jgi:hypothetical protein
LALSFWRKHFVLKNLKKLLKTQRVSRKMACYHSINSVASPKRFDFEAVTEDSDYLGVKRIQFNIQWRLDPNLRTHLGLVKKETIELLPNAKFQLTIQCHQDTVFKGSVCRIFFIDNDKYR